MENAASSRVQAQGGGLSMPKAIGIDFGTTNSAAAALEAGDPVVLENAEGSRVTPSVVAINPKTGERLVGTLAKRQAVTNPENTVFSVKRFMGRKFDDPIVQEAIRRMPYKVTRAQNGDVRIVMAGKEYSPPEIAAMILQKVRADAEAKLGTKVTEAVITVPAYFNDAQRQATKDAGQIAGLEVLRIINEPTSASLAYGLDKAGGEELIAVYDLGGGTFDISILRVGEGVVEVLATNGDTFLGGDDFDRKVMDWIIGEFRKDQGIDLSNDRMALQRIREAAEKAKVELSSAQTTEIALPFISADASGPKHLSMTLTRAKLEQLSRDLIERTREPVMKALEDAKVDAKSVNEVVLVGGQTRMPAVVEMVSKIFGKEPHKGVNPDEVVAVGAAIQAGVLKGEVSDVLLLDVTPLSLGVETQGGVFTVLIPRNTTIPARKSEIFSTATDNQSQVEIHVLQGERPLAAENKSLARFILDGIQPAPRGTPQIEVEFDIDANGILHVSARDKATGKEQRVAIEASSGLSESEVNRLIREAEEHAAEDARRRAEAEERNRADNLAYQAERMLQEAGDRMEPDSRTELQSHVDAIRRGLEQNDMSSVRRSMQLLEQALQSAQQQAYATAGPAAGGAERRHDPSAEQGEDYNTVEGEYREL
jgi:molecular chaperone DnaK